MEISSMKSREMGKYTGRKTHEKAKRFYTYWFEDEKNQLLLDLAAFEGSDAGL